MRGRGGVGAQAAELSLQGPDACGDRDELTLDALALDAALNDAGDSLEGILLGLDGGGRITVRLTRLAEPGAAAGSGGPRCRAALPGRPLALT